MYQSTWMNGVSSTNIWMLQHIDQVWNNTIDTITSFKFTLNTSTGFLYDSTHIQLWKRS